MTKPTTTEHAYLSSILLYLGGTGIALWALFIALEPDVGFVAPLHWMALFWALQIGIGLTVLQLVLYLLTRIKKICLWPLWVVVIASGIVGSVLLSPIYLLIGEGLMERILGFGVSIDGDDDIDTTFTFGMPALVGEFSDIVGPVTTSWALISWPRLQRLVPPLLNLSQPLVAESVKPVSASPAQNITYVDPAWRLALPSELGSELIAVCSELQYIRVWTTRGSALVLGSLNTVEEAEGRAGIRIHRSWWVNAQHVIRVRRYGDGAVCELSNGLEAPVSRRRKADVMARFGSNASYNA